MTVYQPVPAPVLMQAVHAACAAAKAKPRLVIGRRRDHSTTAARKRAIVTLAKWGYGQRAIARAFGIQASYVNQVLQVERALDTSGGPSGTPDPKP